MFLFLITRAGKKRYKLFLQRTYFDIQIFTCFKYVTYCRKFIAFCHCHFSIVSCLQTYLVWVCRETTGGSSGLMVYNREHRNSAFESYKKPTSPTDSKHPSIEGEENDESSATRLVTSGLIVSQDCLHHYTPLQRHQIWYVTVITRPLIDTKYGMLPSLHAPSLTPNTVCYRRYTPPSLT